MSPSKKKPSGFELHDGITIAVNGDAIGKIKDWKPEPLDYEQAYADFRKPVFGGPQWDGFLSSGKCKFPNVTVDVRIEPKTPVPLFIEAQLAMWGIEQGDVFPIACIELLIYELEQAGYHVWFDTEAGLDTEFVEASGVIVQDFKMDYAGAGEDDS
jgi:hypothetical protein